MRIILDQDQIIVKFSERVVEWWNEDNGTSLTVDTIESWDIGLWLGPGGRHFLRACMRYPEFYRDLEPVEGAIRGMKKLIDDGHDVIIASAVPKSAPISYSGKIEWLRRNVPFFPVDNFVAIKRKDLLRGDVLFDDAAHNIEAFSKVGMTVMMETSWNKFVKIEPTRRVQHWNQFLQFIDEVKGDFDVT